MLAIVLSRRDFRESDQIISVYTEDKGKCELFARGIKKIISKNSAHVEPFSVVDIDMVYGKDFNYLTTVQGVEYYSLIRKNLQKSMATQNVIALTDRLVREGDADIRLFNLLYSWLEYMKLELCDFMLIDAYSVALLYCLGFSLCQDDFVMKNKSWIEIIKLCEQGKWNIIVESDIDKKKFHMFVLKSIQYHTERKIVDYTKTCII